MEFLINLFQFAIAVAAGCLFCGVLWFIDWDDEQHFNNENEDED